MSAVLWFQLNTEKTVTPEQLLKVAFVKWIMVVSAILSTVANNYQRISYRIKFPTHISMTFMHFLLLLLGSHNKHIYNCLLTTEL